MATQTELLVIASASQAPEPKNKKSTRRSKRKSRKYADKQADGRKQKGSSSHGHPETKKKYGPDRGVTKHLAREAETGHSERVTLKFKSGRPGCAPQIDSLMLSH